MRFVLSFAFFILPVLSFAELKVPRLDSPVIDEARLIGLRERDELISEIRDYRQRGGAQVAVLTVEDLGGLTVEEASIKIAERWKLGTEKSDQGLLVLISKKERAVRIEVGQGLEGVLPDVQVKRIIEDIMIPYFRDGKFGRGVHEGLVRAAELIDPKVPFYSGYQRDDRPNVVHMPPFFKFLFFLFMIFLFFKFPFLFVGGGRGHRYGGSSWGGGNWGGGSGGWSGGGGGFSGGGASGRW